MSDATPPLGEAPVAAPAVSIVLPCLDEEAGVAICVAAARAALARAGVTGEVLVVDNGSTDGSVAAAEAAGARVVFESRRGYGAALLRGFSEASGDVLVMGDADGSYDFGAIPDFLRAIDDGADFAIGTRLRGTILPGAMPWANRWIGNPVLSGMLRLLFRTSVSDSHCGLRAFTRRAYELMALRSTGMELASEMVVSALARKLVVREVPITYHPRAGISKLMPVRDAWRHVRFMLLWAPSYLFQIPGLLLVALGAILLTALAGGPRLFLGRAWDFHLLLFGAGALLLGYSLVLYDLFAKAFAAGAGLRPAGPWLERALHWFSLERGVAVGLLLFGAGFALEAKIIVDWLRAGHGQMMAVRGVTIGMTAMVAGTQTIFASFLLGLLALERR